MIVTIVAILCALCAVGAMLYGVYMRGVADDLQVELSEVKDELIDARISIDILMGNDL